MPTEPDVTLTDYGLAVLCALFVYLLLARGDKQQPLRIWFALFFFGGALGALTGGTLHGYFLDESTLGHRILWPLTLIAIGASGFAQWGIGAHIYFTKRWVSRIITGAVLLLVLYCILVIFVSQAFVIAIVHYSIASLFMLTIFLLEYRRHRSTPVLLGICAILIAFVAAGVQQAGISLHPVYFTHNALYHVIQAVALILLFRAGMHFASNCNLTEER
jgi:hypothetical protein